MDIALQQRAAQEALGKSLSDRLALNRFREVAETLAEAHARLQRENHFGERMAAAYKR